MAITQRFKEAMPNANIQVDAWTDGDPGTGFDLSHSVSIALFRSDEPTMKALIQKWEFQPCGMQNLDSQLRNQFSEQDLTHPAGGYYRVLLHKKVACYSCPPGTLVANPYTGAILFWDAATGAGCFYIYHSE